jgi:hypothetical protein
VEAILDGRERFEAELQAAGKIVHTERLRRDKEATRLRRKAGPRQVTDGPFGETKEVLGSFYLIPATSRGKRQVTPRFPQPAADPTKVG